MNDKNGLRIWDGDYVVGVDPDGFAYDGIVTGKMYDPPAVLVMSDDGRELELDPRKIEIQELDEMDEPDCGPHVWPPVTG